MRSNERHLAAVAEGPADLEGRLSHKPQRSGLREDRTRQRWFKLRNNLLFYYRLNEYGGVEGEPAGVFVLEECEVRAEPFSSELPFCFSLTQRGEPPRRHLLAALSAAAADQWVATLSNASYERRRAQLRELTAKLRTLTGADPLCSFPGARALKNLASVDETAPGGGVGARAPSFYSHLTAPQDGTPASLLD